MNVTHLKMLLKQKQITAKRLTEMLEIGETSISDWGRGKSSPSPNVLIRMSQILKVSVDELLTGVKPDYPVGESEKLILYLFRKLSTDDRCKIISYMEIATMHEVTKGGNTDSQGTKIPASSQGGTI